MTALFKSWIVAFPNVLVVAPLTRHLVGKLLIDATKWWAGHLSEFYWTFAWRSLRQNGRFGWPNLAPFEATTHILNSLKLCMAYEPGNQSAFAVLSYW